MFPAPFQAPLGTGIGKTVRGQIRRHLPLPDHDATAPESAKVTLHGREIDPAYSRMQIARTDLPLPDVVALNRVHKRLPIPQVDAKRLRKAGLIEGRQPNLHVSAGLAQVTDQQAKVIVTRRQDDLFLAKLVMDYLTQYGSATRLEIDGLLRDKAGGGSTPSQVRRWIAHLLSSMRLEGHIEIDHPARVGDGPFRRRERTKMANRYKLFGESLIHSKQIRTRASQKNYY